MENQNTERQTARIVFYLDRNVIRDLKREKGETDKTMSLIVEEALKRRRRTRKPTAAIHAAG